MAVGVAPKRNGLRLALAIPHLIIAFFGLLFSLLLKTSRSNLFGLFRRLTKAYKVRHSLSIIFCLVFKLLFGRIFQSTYEFETKTIGFLLHT